MRGARSFIQPVKRGIRLCPQCVVISTGDILSVLFITSASDITSIRGFFFVRHAVNLRPIDSLLTRTPRCDGFHHCIARVLRDTHTFSLCSCFDFFEFLRSQQDLYPTRLAIGGGLVVRVCCAFFCHTLSIPHLY